jgi:hypothetical protein
LNYLKELRAAERAVKFKKFFVKLDIRYQISDTTPTETTAAKAAII